MGRCSPQTVQQARWAFGSQNPHLSAAIFVYAAGEEQGEWSHARALVERVWQTNGMMMLLKRTSADADILPHWMMGNVKTQSNLHGRDDYGDINGPESVNSGSNTCDFAVDDPPPLEMQGVTSLRVRDMRALTLRCTNSMISESQQIQFRSESSTSSMEQTPITQACPSGRLDEESLPELIQRVRFNSL